jgi:GntR family transcriptional regulator
VSTLVREPIYHQINTQLRVLIRQECALGDKFLTERQVCERFAVSRATANKALAALVAEGMLEFRKGVGTFVRGQSTGAIDYNLRALVSFTDEARAAGKRPSTEVLQFEKLSAAQVLDEVPQLLAAKPKDRLIYVERLRSADGQPVILERRYIVAGFCPRLTRAEAAGSLYQLLSERYRLDVEGADETLRAVNLRGADARLLQVRDGAAGMLITSVGHLVGGVPLWAERTLYRGDSYEFHNRLGRIQPAGRAHGTFLPRYSA